MENINDLTYKIIGCAYKVHSKLGPGLMESTYETCLEYELHRQGCKTLRQVKLPIVYDEIHLDAGYKIDLLVDRQVILELKATETLTALHKAQLMTYLKLSGIKTGLLLNFNTQDMKNGIVRIVM